MPSIAEPTSQEILWEWLSESGHRVDGEVRLGDAGVIDLVYKTPEGSYVGCEVKDISSLLRENTVTLDPNKAERLSDQLSRYTESKYIDRLYLCTQNASDVLQASSDHMDEELLEVLGGIHVPIDFSRSQEPKITEEPEKLDRQKSPELSRESEQWVQHHIWRKYTPSIREGVLPNRLHKRKNGINRVDVMQFTGSMNPTEVYRNQDENEIIGIEAKSSNLNKEKIKTQLKSYLRSGGLTKLYLAVPESSESDASSILMRQSKVGSFEEGSEEDSGRSITEVGLIIVDTEGNVEVKKEASKQEMLYDGLKIAEHGTNPMAIGWGKEPESPGEFDTVRPSYEFESWFSQRGYYD